MKCTIAKVRKMAATKTVSALFLVVSKASLISSFKSLNLMIKFWPILNPLILALVRWKFEYRIARTWSFNFENTIAMGWGFALKTASSPAKSEATVPNFFKSLPSK